MKSIMKSFILSVVIPVIAVCIVILLLQILAMENLIQNYCKKSEILTGEYDSLVKK